MTNVHYFNISLGLAEYLDFLETSSNAPPDQEQVYTSTTRSDPYKLSISGAGGFEYSTH